MRLDQHTLDTALRSMRTSDPSEAVEHLYVIADLLEATDRAITQAWDAVSKGPHGAGVEKALTDYDFLMQSRELRAIADGWQGQLEAAETEALTEGAA